MTVDLFNGLNTHVWTGWVFFALALGIVLIWGYTVSPQRVVPARVLTSIPSLGHLLHYLARMVLDSGLRQRSLPLRVGLLLVLSAARDRPRVAPALHRQGLQVLIRAQRP